VRIRVVLTPGPTGTRPLCKRWQPPPHIRPRLCPETAGASVPAPEPASCLS